MKRTAAVILIFAVLMQCCALCFAEEAEIQPAMPALTEQPELTEQSEQVELPEPAEQADLSEQSEQVTASETAEQEEAAETAQNQLMTVPAPLPDENRGLLKVDVGEDGSLSCFVAGIPESKMDSIAAEIQSEFPDGELEDPELTDAEKKTLIPDPGDEDCDSMMCWAAGVSDSLWATGWGENLTNPLTGEPFTSEDDLMNYYIQSFTDNSNRMEYALEWFFNGVSPAENPPGYGWARLKRDISEKDALAGDYCVQKLVTVTQVSYDEGNISALDSLLQGIPVNVSAELCDRTDAGTTHALTAMGIIVDPAAEGTDGYYKYILFANSDNSVEGYEETPADTRPNIFNWYPLRLRTTQSGEQVWEIAGFSSDPETVYTRLKSITAIAPYGSEEAEAALETDLQATKNAVNTQDLVAEDIFTSLGKEATEPVTEFRHGSSVWLNFTTFDASYVPCEESFKALVTLTRESDGETVSFYADCNPGEYIHELDRAKDSVQLNEHMTLSSGKYSVCVELNPASAENRLTEAYYLNNLSLTQFFTILAAKDVPADPGYYRPILEADNDGIYISGTDFYGILVNMAARMFSGLEVLKNSGGEEWMTVSAENYRIDATGEAAFRLVFEEGYLETLGEGTHRFRFTLGGYGYCCDVTVCMIDQ